MNISLSIIVPVYNVANYLEICVDSILAQTYKDFELILVDDGSSDGSETICDAYMRKDHRIRVHHQANKGQASARNEGVKLARGEWIAFVDSDDIVPQNAVSSMMGECREGIDIVIGRIASFVGSTEELMPDRDDFSGVDLCGLPGAEAYRVLLEKVSAPLWSPCRNYIRRQHWNEMSAEFQVGITSEDMHLLPRVQMTAGGIALCNDVIYYYRHERPNSTMTGKRLSRELDFFRVVTFYKAFFEKNPQHAVLRESLLRQIGRIQYSVICRMWRYNAEEQRQIIAAAMPHADLLKNCKVARKWKPFFAIFGSKITYRLMAYRNKGR